jgi:hypothetical protein
MVERELTHGEALLLQAVRMLALEGGCRTSRPWFENACGCAGVEAHAMLTAFIQQLRAHGRRRIALAAPAMRRLTDDEALLLSAFGCAQAEDYPGLEARLGGLAAGEPPLALGAAACFVAQILGLSGFTLRAPDPPSAFGLRPLPPTPLPSPASCETTGSAPACAGGWPWA